MTTRGRRTDAVANHARILDAARAVLGERGLDMEVNDVAERAGVGVGTLYRHFVNRDELLRAVLNHTFEDVLTRLRRAAEIEDPREALRQIPLMMVVDQPLFTVMRDPRSIKLIHDVKNMHLSMAGEMVDLIAGIVERGIRAGVFRPDLDPPATAAAILGSFGGVCDLLGTTRPLTELAVLVADLHRNMVSIS